MNVNNNVIIAVLVLLLVVTVVYQVWKKAKKEKVGVLYIIHAEDGGPTELYLNANSNLISNDSNVAVFDVVRTTRK